MAEHQLTDAQIIETAHTLYKSEPARSIFIDGARWARDCLASPPVAVQEEIRSLLWDDHPECCGCPEVGAEYMGQQEMVCCGRPEPALLNDKQIVATLRARFPEFKGDQP